MQGQYQFNKHYKNVHDAQKIEVFCSDDTLINNFMKTSSLYVCEILKNFTDRTIAKKT